MYVVKPKEMETVFSRYIQKLSIALGFVKTDSHFRSDPHHTHTYKT